MSECPDCGEQTPDWSEGMTLGDLEDFADWLLEHNADELRRVVGAEPTERAD